MTTATMPCPSQEPCDGTVTVTTNDHGSVSRCDTCMFSMVASNRGQLDLGVVRDPMLEARNDYSVFFENFSARAFARQFHAFVAQDMATVELWANREDVGVQAVHIIYTHELDGYGLASIQRKGTS